MKELLKVNQESEENEVPSEEQVCSMIARTDEEYEMFMKMDEERQREEEKNAKEMNVPILPRLITRDELPEWLLAPTERKDALVFNEKEYGRGRRRNEFDYSDILDYLGDDDENGEENNNEQRDDDDDDDDDSSDKSPKGKPQNKRKKNKNTPSPSKRRRSKRFEEEDD